MDNANESGVTRIQKVIKVTRERLGLSMVELSDYWGTPLPTLIKWHQGNRNPSTVVFRLIEVLGIIETLAPDIHASILPGKSKPD